MKIWHKNLIAALLVALPLSTLFSSENDCACDLKADKDATSFHALMHSTDLSCRLMGYQLKTEEFIKNGYGDSAKVYLERAAKIHQKLDCHESRKIPFYHLQSNLHLIEGEFQQALDMSLNVLTLAQSQRMFPEEAESRLMIAQILARMGQLEEAMVYVRKTLPLLDKLEQNTQKADIINRAGSRYYFYYQDKKTPQHLDTAAGLFVSALTLSKQLNYQRGIQRGYNKLNSLSFHKKDYRQALLYIDSAIVMAKAGKDRNALATSYGDRGNIYLKMAQYAEARKWADSCLHYNLLEGFPPLVANAYSLQAEIADSMRDYRSAYNALSQEKKITDSLNNADKLKAISELEKKYNQAKNEKTIRELSQQKQIYSLFALAAVLGLVIIGFFLRQQSLRNRQRILETEQRLNRARINPHFFFNALTSLQSLALKEQDGRKIAIAIAKFSRIMRETLESTYHEYNTIGQEAAFLEEYLTLQQLRFPGKFDYQIDQEDSLDPDDTMLPSMILQPFVENSIEHGFQHMEHAGIITIRFTRENQVLRIDIEDNGRGLNEQEKKDSTHISRAGQIIRDRIYLMNAQLKSKARFSISNQAKGSGVHVQIDLPLLSATDIERYSHKNQPSV